MTPDDLPAGPILVDTNVFSLVMVRKGRYRDFEPFLVGRLPLLPFVCVGELLAGAHKAHWGRARLDGLWKEIHKYVIMWANPTVVEKYALLHARFSGKLRPRGGANDMWIAAIALAQPEPLPILTENRGEFETMASEFPLVVVHPDVVAPPRAP